MIDYVNTEIVQYADVLPTFDACYPSIIYGPLLVQNVSGVEVSYDMRISYNSLGIVCTLEEGGRIATDWPELVGDTIYGFSVVNYGGRFLSDDERKAIGTCYYVVAPRSSPTNLVYWRLTLSDIPDNIVDPFLGGGGLISGSDIFWLYSLGNFLFSNISFATNLLNFSISGYNFISLLFGAGFLIYVGWCVTKWFIPL